MQDFRGGPTLANDPTSIALAAVQATTCQDNRPYVTDHYLSDKLDGDQPEAGTNDVAQQRLDGSVGGRYGLRSADRGACRIGGVRRGNVS